MTKKFKFPVHEYTNGYELTTIIFIPAPSGQVYALAIKPINLRFSTLLTQIASALCIKF